MLPQIKEATMKSHVVLTIEATRKRFLARLGRHLLLLPLLAMVASPQPARAQSGQSSTPDAQTLQVLMQRIDELEARVRQLEAAQRQPASAATLSAPQQPVSSPSQATPPQTSPATSLSNQPKRTLRRNMNPNRPNMRRPSAWT